METFAAVLAPNPVTATDGEEVLLGSLWKERPVLLVFVRHFGCIYCREQVAELVGMHDAIKALGAELIVIGNGEARYAEGFAEALALEAPVYSDPSLGSYRAAGLKRGILASLGPATWRNFMRARRAGATQGRTQGDRWQQGGVFVVLPGGLTTYMFRSAVAGEHPDPNEVLRALSASIAAAHRPG